MKPLFFISVLCLAVFASEAKADLGGADITGPSGETTTGRTYKARCGADKDKCTVSFKDGKLVVNDKGGIYRDQFVNVVRNRVCTQRALLMPFVTSCFENQYDIAFTITTTTMKEVGDLR